MSEGESGLFAASTDEEKFVPFLKWPGGKRWLVASYPNLLPSSFGRYIEPFLGAGSMYLHLRPSGAILGDLNPDVVEAFVGIREDPLGLQILLEQHHQKHCTEYYYWVRSHVPKGLVGRAARTIYLNRTCFNGIYRVNQLGQFNVPIGDRQTVIFPTDNWPALAELLATADLSCGDFEPLIDQATVSDLVFLDPPYTVRHNMNGFRLYNEKLFSWEDQERLAKAARAAHDRGAMIFMTNAAHPTVEKLYDRRKFSIQPVTRYSAISSSVSSRKLFDEIIITSRGRK